MIKVNMREMEWENGMTVQNLLDKCKFIFPHIVVKINGTVIPRKQYVSTKISDNDDVQVIHLISGG